MDLLQEREKGQIKFYAIQVSYALKNMGYPAFSSALSEVGRGGLGKAYWF